jgi:hypothetical protein
VRLNAKAVRAKMRRRLVKQKKQTQLREFLTEIRTRAAGGYSVRQLMQSHIPDMGSEVKVPASEVTAAVQSHEVSNLGRPRELINFLFKTENNAARKALNKPNRIPVRNIC